MGDIHSDFYLIGNYCSLLAIQIGMGGIDMKWDENDAGWKWVQVSVTVRAILIVLGALLVQMVSAIICFTAAGVMAMAENKGGKADLYEIFNGYLQNQQLLIWASLLSAVIMGIWCGILYRKSAWRQENMNYRRVFCSPNLLSIAGIGMGGCVLLTVLLSAVATIVPEAFQSYNQVMDALTGEGTFINVLYVLLVGPVSEELIFRGAVFDRFFVAFPFFVANILQAALFGLYHMNLIQGVYAFLLGLALGLVRQATGSILASILVHIIFNSTSWLSGLVLPERTPQLVIFLMAAAASGCCILGIRHMMDELNS